MKSENLYASSMEINMWVGRARKHKGLTQEQLGEALGRGKANVSGWETGKHEPSYSQIRAIAEITGYPMPDGVRELFTASLVERLKELSPTQIRTLEEQLRVQYGMPRLPEEASFQKTTDAQTPAQKSTYGLPDPLGESDADRRALLDRRTSRRRSA